MNELAMDAQALAGVIEQAQVALRSCDSFCSTSPPWRHKAAACRKPKAKRQPRSSGWFESWSPTSRYLSSH